MPFTNQPVVLIVHYDVRPGHQLAFQSMWDAMVIGLEGAKPRTAAYLGYLSGSGADLTLIHVFPDARAMAAHVLRPDDRWRAAYEHIIPAGYEIYGEAPAEVLEQFGNAALAAAVDLVVQPSALGGFLRTTVS